MIQRNLTKNIIELLHECSDTDLLYLIQSLLLIKESPETHQPPFRLQRTENHSAV